MEETWWTNPEQLDEYQAAVIPLSSGEDHLVLGPPGSGKTNLLVLRAAHLYGAGVRNIAVLTFGRVLKEFLTSGSDHYELPPNRFLTYVGWAAGLLEQNDVPLNRNLEFEELRAELLSKLDDLSKLERPENIFDCILLDEVQDYTPEEVKVIRRFTTRLFATGDEKQRIYRNAGTIEFLRSSIQSVHELKFHYRNGLKICRMADGIRNMVGSPDGMETNSNYDEKRNPSAVADSGNISISEQVTLAIPEIQRQLRAYPEAFIGVLCPRRQELSEVSVGLARSSIASQVQTFQSDERYQAFDSERRVIAATVHGGKGLEFRALHLMGMNCVVRFGRMQKNLAYTAVTRAKTSLSIYSSGSLPAYVEQGIVAANGNVSTPPKLAELFKNRDGSRA